LPAADAAALTSVSAETRKSSKPRSWKKKTPLFNQP
jgi:hypothetical protein